MPNINGTGGNDNIDVTNDDGTLNGNPQGTPIDNIRGRGGNDTISVTDSTIANSVRGNAGADEITILNSTVSGIVHGGGGADTIDIEGSTIVGDIRLGNGNDTLSLIGTTVSGVIRGNGGTDTFDLPVGTVINDTTFGMSTVTDGGNYSLSSGTFTLPSGTVITYTSFNNGTGFPCFGRGTLIATALGYRPIEKLEVGDAVTTWLHERQPIRWIGKRRFNLEDLTDNPKLRPVRILAGALGDGLPLRDMLVSRQHRMLVESKIAARMFGRTEVLVPAIKLTGLPGIFVDETVESVEYFHLLFDQHEIIFGEGAPTESLYTGPEALKSLSPEAREEIFTIFPELIDRDYEAKPALHIPPGKSQKQLVARHLKNSKPALNSDG